MKCTACKREIDGAMKTLNGELVCGICYHEYVKTHDVTCEDDRKENKMQKVIRSISNESLPNELNDLLADGWAIKNVTPIILSEKTYIEYVIEKA